MKPGEKMAVLNHVLLEPLVGRIITVQIDGEEFTAKISDIGYDVSYVTIVDPATVKS